MRPLPFHLPPYLDQVCIALVTRIGSGYLQQNFSFQCGCGFDVNKERLAVFKLVKDLTSAAQYLPFVLFFLLPSSFLN